LNLPGALAPTSPDWRGLWVEIRGHTHFYASLFWFSLEIWIFGAFERLFFYTATCLGGFFCNCSTLFPERRRRSISIAPDWRVAITGE
jgi:hypothetical protein